MKNKEFTLPKARGELNTLLRKIKKMSDIDKVIMAQHLYDKVSDFVGNLN